MLRRGPRRAPAFPALAGFRPLAGIDGGGASRRRQRRWLIWLSVFAAPVLSRTLRIEKEVVSLLHNIEPLADDFSLFWSEGREKFFHVIVQLSFLLYLWIKPPYKIICCIRCRCNFQVWGR